jgi:hypothetical protein
MKKVAVRLPQRLKVPGVGGHSSVCGIQILDMPESQMVKIGGLRQAADAMAGWWLRDYYLLAERDQRSSY